MGEDRPRLFILDISSLAYRAYFALSELQTSTGRPSGGVFNFLKLLLKLIRDYQPEYITACGDSPEPTFRHKEYPRYKEQRKEMPSEMKAQVPFFEKILSAFQISIISSPGYEADDIIGSLTQQFKEKFLPIIVSSDRDLFQLLSPGVKMMFLKKGVSQYEFYDEQKVIQEYGLTPHQLTDMIALKGDPSDNIPGVPGIGLKTAITLLQRFRTLEELFQRLSEVSELKLRQRLTVFRDQARLSKKLASIVCEIPLEVEIKRWEKKKIKINILREICEEFEFKSLLSQINDLEGNNHLSLF